MLLLVLTAAPNVGPDDLKTGTPPSCVLLPASNGLRLDTHCSVGTAGVRPYFYIGDYVSDHRWQPLGLSATDPTVGRLDVDNGLARGCQDARYVANGEGCWWCVVRESGTGTVDKCDLQAVHR